MEGISAPTQPRPDEALRPRREAVLTSEQDTENPWLALAPKRVAEATSPKQETRSGRGSKKEASPEVAESMRQFQEDLRRKEELGEAIFAVSIDRARLTQIKIPDRQRNSYRTGNWEIDAEYDADQAQGQRELEELLERFQRLPEKLQFQPGITLIVGENGSGKSTLAKALFLQAKYQQTLRHDRERPAFRGDQEEFARAEVSAYQYVFEPSKSLAYERVWLNQAGLASDVAKSMTVDNFHSAAQSGDYIEYTDFPQVIGQQTRGEYDYAASDFDKGNFNGWEDHRSHRQTVDQFVFGELERKKERNPGAKVYFFDEPETGMSPRLHRNIEQEIIDCTTGGSIVVVPTNSVVLFDSDLPRIDLDFPERGIHVPSQFPEAKQ